VPALRAGVRLRPGLPGGGIACYPEDRLFQEAAYIAYHFHWPKEQILDLTHRERHRWVEEISKINKKINKSSGGGGGGGSGVPTSFGGGGMSIGQGPLAGINLEQPDDDDEGE
jgi:hypothetical protein